MSNDWEQNGMTLLRHVERLLERIDAKLPDPNAANPATPTEPTTTKPDDTEKCSACGGAKDAPKPCRIRGNGCWMWDNHDQREWHTCRACDGTCHASFHGRRYYTDSVGFPKPDDTTPETCPTCGWPEDEDGLTRHSRTATTCPQCGRERETFGSGDGTHGFLPYHKPDDTTPETCPTCGGTREAPNRLIAGDCYDTFHTTPETNSTHLLGGFGASAEYDTDFEGEGGR